MENNKVKLEYSGGVKELPFDHALNILRNDKHNIFKVIGKHQFVDNELIIKPSTKGRKKSSKPAKGKGGAKVSESSKDSDRGV